MGLIDFGHYKNVKASQWPWPNFTPAEMACRDYRGPDAGKLKVDTDAMDKLQRLRELLGKPMHVNSAYRAPAYNRKIGGAKNSQHLSAKAFDISMANQDPHEFEIAARKAGFTGFGFYKKSNFIHIDTGPAREWGKRWWVVKKSVAQELASVDEREFQPEVPVAPANPVKDPKVITAGLAATATAGTGVVNAMRDLDPMVTGGLIVAALAALWMFRDAIKDRL